MVALGTTDVRICLGLAAEGSSATGEAHWRGRPGSWALTAAAGPRASTHCWARLARSRTVPLASLGQTEATTPGGEAPRKQSEAPVSSSLAWPPVDTWHQHFVMETEWVRVPTRGAQRRLAPAAH